MAALRNRRPHITLTTAGHVDHGKSTLLRALTGVDPDRLPDERRRGLTIELGFVWCTLASTDRVRDDIEVAFVDVPGHERFVATMLAGVGPAAASVLVVAADDGWSAQTQEHAEVLALLGIPVVATVLSKTVPAGPARTAAVDAQVAGRLAAMGFADAPLVHTDAVAGVGLDRLRLVLRERLATLRAAPSGETGAKLWIDRAFVVDGAGTVVTGTLGGGPLEVGDRVRIEPDGPTARIRGLAALGRPVDVAGPGERVAVNLAGLEVSQVPRGRALVTEPHGSPTRVLDGWATVLAGRRLRDRGAWHVHAGTARTSARLLPVPDPIDATRTVRRPAASVADAATGVIPAASGVVGGQGALRVVLERPLPLRSGEVLVVRDAGVGATVGAIRVADPAPLRLPRGRPARQAHARRVHAAANRSGSARLAPLVALHGGVRAVDNLRAATGLHAGRGGSEDLAGSASPADPARPDGVVRVEDYLVDVELVNRWRAALGTLDATAHDRGQVAQVLQDAGAPERLVGPLLDQFVRLGTLRRTDAGYLLPDDADSDARRRHARRDALVHALEAAPFTPPALDEVARRVGADANDVAVLVRQGRLVRAGPVTFTGAAVAEARRRLAGSSFADRGFTAAEARDVLGTSRRYIIPLLEHLARTGVTSFDGAHHRFR